MIMISKPSFKGQIHPRRKTHSGFALIATISVMVLLVMIALAMLSLSTISARATINNKAAEEARQNARLSLMMGIAQLQSLTGPDTRVTANSRLFSENNVAATGVWRSWEGTNQDSSGKPTVPDYGLKKQPGDPTEEPSNSNGDGRFLGWLGSTSMTPAVDDLSDFSTTNDTEENEDYVLMLGEGSVTEPENYVYVKPTYVQDSRGALAWWTSGNNSKAMINVDRVKTPNDTIEWHQRVRSNGRADAETFGLAAINTLPEGAAIPTTNTLKLVENAAEVRKFHDLTTYSRGLLTNVSTGGWKKDLSLMAEQFTDLPNSGLPAFTMEPGVVNTFDKATSDANRPHSGLLYPWSRYRTLNGSAWGTVPPVCSWTALTDYALQYKKLTTSSAAKTSMPIHISGIGGNSRYEFQEQTRRSPQLARIQWIFSLCSKKDTSTAVPNQYNPGLMITPVVTLWNPYNVELTVNRYTLQIQKQGLAPLRFSFDYGAANSTNLVSIGSIIGVGERSFFLNITQPFTLAPGATRVFSLNDGVPRDGGSSNSVTLTPGFIPGGGLTYYRINNGGTVSASGNVEFSIDEVAYSASSQGDIGIWIETKVNGNHNSNALRMGYSETELLGAISELYPSLVERASARLSEIDGPDSFAFASSMFGFRTATTFTPASIPADQDNHKHLITKGMLQSHPLNFYTEVGNQDNNATLTSMANSGVFHPVNAPYDFAFLDVNGWNDTQFMPQLTANNDGYIVSGLTVGDGLTHCVMAELPTRPLQSLAQLQHFDARNNNPIPPFQYNLIGNGSAHPLFAPAQTSIPTSTNSGMINDDTYLLNQMLFDDWFVSSIAPDLDNFSKNIGRDLEQVYADHLKGEEPLPNRFYIPAAGADPNKVSQAKDNDTGLYTYQTIASQLVVDGMFNINSVSLDAWKAILRHSRDTKTPYLNTSGATVLDSATSYPYPRTTIAGDPAASSGDTEEFSGYRTLTEEQIDALAEEIVKEIRARGPFLSLSEFVNRQLTSDEDLAIAGTIQKALDNLSEMPGSKNPYKKLQELSTEITLADISAIPGNTDYKFNRAAAGYSAFGVPGWVRQADILTPLAPVITARDDSFTIRAYGDARTKDENNRIIILATAWCEATVRRVAEYVDNSDAIDVEPYSTEMTSDINKRYGRRYRIVSFRWLNEAEI